MKLFKRKKKKKAEDDSPRALCNIDDTALKEDINGVFNGLLPIYADAISHTMTMYYHAVDDETREGIMDDCLAITRDLTDWINDRSNEAEYPIAGFFSIAYMLCALQARYSEEDWWQECMNFGYALKGKMNKKRENEVNRGYG